MGWMNEMFVNMEKDRTEDAANRSAHQVKVDRTEHPKKRIPGELSAWNALVSSIATDVNDFNNAKERAGHTAARISKRNFQCEVHLSGMQGKTLVLSLDNHDLHISVHPDFPEQKATITLELDSEGQHGFWILGHAAKESAKLSAPQLSEYLLKPILSCATINRAP
jgi:hypothetical protein